MSFNLSKDDTLLRQALALIDGEPDFFANLANLSALLNQHYERLNWVGFYLVQNESLVLGPFQGKVACTRIPKGKGVCGTAWAKAEAIYAPNVHEFPGHIACDSASESELVVPLRLDGRIVGVLDIDSPFPDRFEAAERIEIIKLVEAIGFQLAQQCNYSRYLDSVE